MQSSEHTTAGFGSNARLRGKRPRSIACQRGPSNPQRREFLAWAVRLAAAAAIAGAVGSLTSREDKLGESCTGNGMCRGCTSLDTCGLPAAMSCRRALAEKGTGSL